MATASNQPNLQYAKLFTIEDRLGRMVALLKEGGRSSPQLADELGVSIPTVARDVKALRQLGYQVKAERSGRCWQYSLLSRKLSPIKTANGPQRKFTSRGSRTGAT